MRKIKYILGSLLLILTVFYVLPVGLLQVPAVQKKISDKVSVYLKDKLKTEVSIGSVNFKPFNQLVIKDVYVADEAGETLLQAKRLSAGFDLFSLFQKQFRIHSLQLYTFECNLQKETDDSPLNIQYIIDAFASDNEEDKDTPVDLEIHKLDLRRGNFSFQVKNAGKTPGKFNPKDIRLENLSTTIRLNKLKYKELDAVVDRLGFTEQSGFALEKLTFDVSGDKDSLRIDHLSLQLNRTIVKINDILADYSMLPDEDKETKDIKFRMSVEPSALFLKEITAFVPVFNQFEDKVELEGKLEGTLNDMNLTDFYMRDQNRLQIYTTARIKNLISDPKNLYLSGNVTDTYVSPEGLNRLLNNFREDPFVLPQEVYNLGILEIEAGFEGYITHLSTHGNFSSDIGQIEADVVFGQEPTISIKGSVSSSSFHIGDLLANRDLEDVSFRMTLDAEQNDQNQLEGDLDALIEHFVYKGHRYENLHLDGEFSPEHFTGLLDFDNPEGQLRAEGFFLFKGKDSEFRFQAEMVDVQLENLNLTHRYENSSLSLFADANFSGNNPDNVLGDIRIRDLEFSTDDGTFSLDSFWINASQWENEKKVLIQSPILNGEIYGIYSSRSIVHAVKRTLSLYLPALVAYNPRSFKGEENNFSFDLYLEPTDTLSLVLELPVTVQSPMRVHGQYNSIYDKFHLEADIPKAIVMGSSIENTALKISNLDGRADLNLFGINLQNNNRMEFQAKLNAANDLVSSTINWGNVLSKYKGGLNLDVLFAREETKSPLRTKIQFHPSELVFNDSIWTLSPTEIRIDSSNVRIDNLLLAHEDQFVNIKGAISHIPEEELFVHLNKVDLDFIFKSLGKKALEFGGIASGIVNAKDIYKTRELSTDLDVKDFSFNNVVFGDLDLTGTWDDETQGILMDGWVYKNDSTTVDVDGVIYPVKEELSITFDAQNADARFLRKYLNSVIQDITGDLTGKIRLFGDLNDPTVEGVAYAQDFRFFVEYLNAYYSFTDSVVCLPDEFQANNITLYDERGRTGTINGFVKHHLFTDFAFSAGLSFADFQVFNATKSTNPLFYGTVYGTGSANLYGTEDVVNIDVSIQNTGNSRLSLNFMEENEIVDYDFINFVKRNPDPETALSDNTAGNGAIRTDNGTEIRFNLMLNVTPEANVEMIMDPLAGDKITANGSGNMQIQYGTKTPLRVFGNYKLDRGKYNFSLQHVIFRNFDIQEGSEIVFRGDPYTAELNIDARYTVTANLGDLDQQLIHQNLSARNNIPVDCILLLGGPLNHPTIAFDLDLPGATAELTRQVKSYIRTEDMMNRQIVYLLVLSRFYTSPEYATGDYNNDFSYLTSTLSNQLSNLLGTLSDKFQIGTKFHQSFEGEQSNTEIELLLSSQLLNDRLIINGNFGYIDNPYVNTAGQNVPLVGDFDIEYKLTKSGDIRLKGFNHYNYRNYFSQTPEMTQGLGILFRKDFDRFTDFFSRWIRKEEGEGRKEEGERNKEKGEGK